MCASCVLAVLGKSVATKYRPVTLQAKVLKQRAEERLIAAKREHPFSPKLSRKTAADSTSSPKLSRKAADQLVHRLYKPEWVQNRRLSVNK
jgi:hypothetical protein